MPVEETDTTTICRARTVKFVVLRGAAPWVMEYVQKRGVDAARSYPGNKGYVQHAFELAMFVASPNVTWSRYGNQGEEDHLEFDETRDLDPG